MFLVSLFTHSTKDSLHYKIPVNTQNLDNFYYSMYQANYNNKIRFLCEDNKQQILLGLIHIVENGFEKFCNDKQIEDSSTIYGQFIFFSECISRDFNLIHMNNFNNINKDITKNYISGGKAKLFNIFSQENILFTYVHMNKTTKDKIFFVNVILDNIIRLLHSYSDDDYYNIGEKKIQDVQECIKLILNINNINNYKHIYDNIFINFRDYNETHQLEQLSSTMVKKIISQIEQLHKFRSKTKQIISDTNKDIISKLAKYTIYIAGICIISFTVATITIKVLCPFPSINLPKNHIEKAT